MKVYEGSDVRNVALVGHGNSGKTSLAAGMLFGTGATNRLTRVDEGNTLTDFDDEEVARKITISTSLAYVEWKKKKINLLDTPGFNIFINDTKAAMVAAEAALVMVDGVAGVEVQTEKVWQFADEFKLPRAVVINKLDRERSSFERSLESVQSVFGRSTVPLHLPIGAERDFKGIVDLIRMKSYTYTPDGDGKGKEGDIPADMADAATKGHEALVEMVAEGNDALLEEFFAEGTLPVEHIVDGLRQAVRDMRIVPILCMSALHNIATDQAADFMVDYFPAPTDRGTVTGSVNGTETQRKVADSEPVSAYVFKTVADPFAGRVSYFKVYVRVHEERRQPRELSHGRRASAAHIGTLLGKTITPVTEVRSRRHRRGREAQRNDDRRHALRQGSSIISVPAVQLPEPSIAYAIAAKTSSGRRPDGQCHPEDPRGGSVAPVLPRPADEGLPAGRQRAAARRGDRQPAQTAVRRRCRTCTPPRSRTAKRFAARADVQGRHKKQTGGHGQFGDCWIRVEPLPRGEKFQFANEIFGGAIPRTYVPAVEKGIRGSRAGLPAGYPMVDFKVTVFDGSYHDVDSSEMSFKMAARKAFKAAMEKCKPRLLEPVMNVEVQAPVEFAGDLMGDMNGRRGRISGMDTKGGTQFIRAQVPMAEMLTYQNDLISMTQGRGILQHGIRPLRLRAAAASR